jgi:hypothetical protein
MIRPVVNIDNNDHIATSPFISFQPEKITGFGKFFDLLLKIRYLQKTRIYGCYYSCLAQHRKQNVEPYKSAVFLKAIGRNGRLPL